MLRSPDTAKCKSQTQAFSHAGLEYLACCLYYPDYSQYSGAGIWVTAEPFSSLYLLITERLLFGILLLSKTFILKLLNSKLLLHKGKQINQSGN